MLFTTFQIITSLDHAMWFHAPFRADRWMLFDMQSVKTAGGRGMNIGFIYNETGELAITSTQEALIRLNKHKPDAAASKV
jgi:acyl-CoA thioesterase II